ncbi:hypothetical protein Tco_1235814 [Tanacetum coccineum]
MSTNKNICRKLLRIVGEDADFNSGVGYATNYVNAFGGTSNWIVRETSTTFLKKKTEQSCATDEVCSSNALGDFNATRKSLSGYYSRKLTAMDPVPMSQFLLPNQQSITLTITKRNVVEVSSVSSAVTTTCVWSLCGLRERKLSLR